MTGWRMTSIETERKYEISDAPDLQDSTSPHRRVLRPRTLKIHQEYGTNRVALAVVEGQQVRRDGELAGRCTIQVLVGPTWHGWTHAEPPEWLSRLLSDEGLEWVQDGAR